MIEYKYYGSSGDLRERWLYEYDVKRNIINRVCYKKNNISNELDKNHETLYEYNRQNQRSKLHNQYVYSIFMDNFKPSEIKEKITAYKYDSKGNAIEMNTNSRTKKSFEDTNTVKYDTIDIFLKYNHYNDIIEKNTISREKVLDYNLLINNGVEEYYNPTEINYFKYEYDSNDNWTKRTEYDKNKEPVKITVREIEYYQ